MSSCFNRFLSVLLGGVFVVAGAIKIWNVQIKKVPRTAPETAFTVSYSRVPDLAKFASDMLNYRVPPRPLNNLVAITVPWIEVIAGGLLMAGVWKRANALLIAVMLVVFMLAIGQAAARGLNIDCGCFGTVEGRQVGLMALGEDSLMLAAALWLVWREKQ